MDNLTLWKNLIGTPTNYEYEKSFKFVKKYEYENFDCEYYLQANGVGSLGKPTYQRVLMTIPKNIKGKAPAVVIPFYYPERMLGFNPCGELKDSSYPIMQELAERGFITISAEAYYLTYLNEKETYDKVDLWQKSGDALNANHPNWCGVGKLIADTQLLIDVLELDKRVDSQKIAIWGHSLGGKMAFYTGSLDDRIKVIVASDFGIIWEQTNWQDAWYWGEKLKDLKAKGIDHKSLLKASNKKPFCIIAGEYDNDDSYNFVYSIEDYKDCKDRLLVINHQTGHKPPKYARDCSYSFIEYHLK